MNRTQSISRLRSPDRVLQHTCRATPIHYPVFMFLRLQIFQHGLRHSMPRCSLGIRNSGIRNRTCSLAIKRTPRKDTKVAWEYSSLSSSLNSRHSNQCRCNRPNSKVNLVRMASLHKTRCSQCRTRCNLSKTRCNLSKTRCNLSKTRCNLSKTRCNLSKTRCNLSKTRCSRNSRNSLGRLGSRRRCSLQNSNPSSSSSSSSLQNSNPSSSSSSSSLANLRTKGNFSKLLSSLSNTAKRFNQYKCNSRHSNIPPRAERMRGIRNSRA